MLSTTESFREIFIVALVGFIVLAASVNIDAQGITAIVAETGDLTPDGSNTITFNLFPNVSISNYGSAVFSTSADANELDQRLMRGNGVLLEEIARSGDSVRGGDYLLDRIDVNGRPAPAVNALGSVLYQSSADPPTNLNQNFESILLGSPTSQTLVVIGPDTVPAIAGGDGNFGLVNRQQADLSDTGFAAFSTRLTNTSGGGSSDDRAIYRYDSSTGLFTEIVRAGNAAPNGNGTFFGGGGSSQYGSPTINDLGQVAFKSAIVGTASGDEGIFRGDGGTPVTIARRGDALGGSTIRDFGVGESVQINQSGRVAFYADLISGADVVAYGDGTFLTKVAQIGDATRDGGLRSFRRHVAFNDLNQILFEGQITASTGVEDGLFVASSGSLTEIARTGDALPQGGGATFASIQDDGFAINDQGDVAFQARFTDGTVFNQEVILFHSETLGLLEVARVGETFQNSVITSLEFQGTSSFEIVPQSMAGLNDAGQVAFSYVLADDTRGVAIWQATSGPSTLLGDYNGNGEVDAADYTIWADNFNSTVNPFFGADGNGDGVINAADYTVWADNFGNTAALSSGSFPVPEPSSLVLLALGGSVALGRRLIR